MAARVALLAIVLAGLAGLYASGFFALIAEPARVRTLLDGLGVWAPILYVASFALLEPFFVPGVAFIVPGALAWGFWKLFLLSWLGAVGAGVVGFCFARYLGRHYVETHLPVRFRRYDTRLAERGLETVILVRLLFFLAPPAHWVLGLSQVSFPRFLAGTAIGFVPGIAALCLLVEFAGQTLGDWLGERPPGFWAALAAIVAGFVVLRRRRASRERAAPVS